MYKKNNSLGIGLSIVLLAIAAIGSIVWYASQPQSKALADTTNIQQPVKSQETPASDLISQVTSGMPKLQTVNGTTVELSSVKKIETGIEVGICYPTPDGGDWYPTAGALSYSTYEILPDEFEFISEQKADGIHTGRRCALIRYRIDEMENITTPIQFTLLGYWAVPKELPPCENLQQRLNTNPRAKSYGLKAKCSYDDQTGLSVALSGKASSIAQDKAQQVLDEIVKGEVNGPWEFTITELEK